jgi:putative transposase
MQQRPSFLERMADRQPNGITRYRFWQRGGGYDRNVMQPKSAYLQIDYIHQNPVRRGLCSRAEDWQWSSAADHAGSRDGPLRVDRGSLPVVLE